MIEDWFAHQSHFEYEYEYRFTEYEYDEAEDALRPEQRGNKNGAVQDLR